MKRPLITVMVLAVCMLIVTASGCIPAPARKPKTASSDDSLKSRLTEVATAVLRKVGAEPDGSVAVLNFSVSGLESARGEFFAQQVTLSLNALSSRKELKARVVSRPDLLARVKKGGFSEYDLLEPDRFTALMKTIDTDFAVLGNMTEKQFTYLVDVTLLDFKGAEVLKIQVEVFKEDIVAEKVNAFGRAMGKLAYRLVNGYKGFDSHRVAVYAFKENSMISPLGEQIARELPNYLAKTLETSMLATQIEILTRTQLDQIVREQRITMDDLFEKGDQAFGKLLQASAIISGDIAHREGGIYITAQMVDLKTGTLVSSGEVRYTEESVLTAAARDVVGDTVLKADRDPDSGFPVEIISSPDSAVMVLVPGGLFKGIDYSDGKKEKIEKDIPVFYIDKYEVTNAQYCAFLNATSRLKEDGHTLIDLLVDGTKIYSRGSEYEVRPGFEKHPVVNVTWYGATAYARWAGKRLPELVEWEKAAGWDPVKRALRTYPWGNSWDGGIANHGKGNDADASDGHEGPAPVSEFEKGRSFYGVMNAAGNVWEWCGTVKKQLEYIDSLGTKVQKIVEKAVVMGGSFRKGGDTLTTTSALFLDPNVVNFSVGFRCVKDPE